jgi:hypothetical protein
MKESLADAAGSVNSEGACEPSGSRPQRKSDLIKSGTLVWRC